MKDSLRVLVLAALGVMVFMVAIRAGRPAAGPFSARYGEMNPLSGPEIFPAVRFPQASHHHGGGSLSIWQTCTARGMNNPALVSTDVPSAEQMAVVVASMGTHDHRVDHLLWHTMRSALDTGTRTEIVSSYGSQWNNPHAECPIAGSVVDGNYNPFGEDFLYMHRGMVNMIQQALIDAGLPCIGPWAALPAPADETWPVPDEDGQGVKSDEAYQIMKDWETAFEDPNWLLKHSLSQVGFFLENTLHNNMHNRFATANPPAGFDQGVNIPLDNHFPSDWPYDNAAYDWLADPYGAAANPHFWKLHGLVDQILDRWLAANGYKIISENCTGQIQCYEWKGKWVGAPMGVRTHFGSAKSTGHSLPMLGFTKGALTESALRNPPRTRTVTSWANDPETWIQQSMCNQ